jgi:hypothetical protein
VLPNAGTVCTPEAMYCMYEGCKLAVHCESGVWRWSQVAC